MQDYLLHRQKLMHKYIEIRGMETKDKSEINKLLTTAYESIRENISEQLKVEFSNAIINTFNRVVLDTIPL